MAPKAGAALLAIEDLELETLYYVQDGAEGPRGWKVRRPRNTGKPIQSCGAA